MFLVHDINFHRSVAAASGNPIVASLVEMVSALYYERRRDTAARRQRARSARRGRGAPPDLSGDPRHATPTRPRQAMHAHLLQASEYQSQEPTSRTAQPARPSKPRPSSRQARNGRRPSTPSDRILTDVPLRFDTAARPSWWAARAASAARWRSGSPTPAPTSSSPAGAPTASTRSPPRSDTAAGGRCRWRPTPRTPASLERLRDACAETLGGVDIMIYAAGVTKRVPTLDMDRGGLEAHHRHEPDRRRSGRARCSAAR